MLLRGRLQAKGLVNLPAHVELDSPACEVTLTLADLNVAIRVPLQKWKTRKWFRIPIEIAKLCDSDLAYELQPLTVLSKESARSIIPISERVRFSATVHGHDAFQIAVPPAWYRGMKHAEWSDEVRVRVKTPTGTDYTFTRTISVRGHAIALTLPKRICTDLHTGDAVIVELTRAVKLRAKSVNELDLQGYPIKEWPRWSIQYKNEELTRLVALYRQHGFPWEAVEAKREQNPLSAVQKSAVTVQNEVITRVGYAGQGTCLSVHQHRYRARYQNNVSVVDAFNDDDKLRRALQFQLDCGDPVTPHRLLNALSALHKGPLNFPPALARWLVDQYAPDGGTVLDPCSGYGGRLLGTLASSRNVNYVGADVEPDSVDGNRRLAALLRAENRVEQFQRAVEDPIEWPRADLVLVGPPYFNRENYGVISATIVSHYPTYQDWVRGFLTTLIDKSIRSSPRVVINLAKLRSGKNVLDLPNDAIRLANSLGASAERLLTWQLSRFGNSRQENIIVFRR